MKYHIMDTAMLKILFFLLIFSPLLSLASNTSQTTLPLTFDSGNKSPYGMASTVVSINGKKMPLIFDLGDSKGFITLLPAAMKNLKVHFTGRKICGETMNGTSCRKLFIISTLKLGKFELHNVTAALSPKIWGGGPPMKHPGAFRFGVIGMKLMQNYGVLIDFSHANAILTENYRLPENYHSKTWTTVPFTIKGGVSTASKINGHHATFVWDTGAVPSIINKKILYGNNPLPCSKSLPYGNNHCQFINTKTLSVAGKKLPNTWFILAAIPAIAPFNGLIGDNFFRHNIVFINFKDKTLSISRVNAGTMAPNMPTNPT